LDIHLLKTLLEVLSSVGVEEAVVEPSEDGTLVRGANKDRSVIIYHTIPDSLLECPMGIQSVKGMLSRLELFDSTKSAITTTTHNDLISDLTVKQGRKKASYKCAEPSALTVPKKVPGDLSIVKEITFDKAYVDYLSQAITAMSYTGSKQERSISISVKAGDLELTIFDGEDDSFVDEMKVDDFEDTKKISWDVQPFQRVLKQSLECRGESAAFTISEHGIAVFDLSLINVLVAPISR
jgi:hypothetical protein